MLVCIADIVVVSGDFDTRSSTVIVVPETTVSVIASGIITIECVDGDSVVVMDAFRASSISSVVSTRVAGRRVIVLFGMECHVVRRIVSVVVSIFSLKVVVVDRSSVDIDGGAVISLSPRRGSLLSIVRIVVVSRSILVVVSTETVVDSVMLGAFVVVCLVLVDVVGIVLDGIFVVVDDDFFVVVVEVVAVVSSIVVIVDASVVVVTILVGLDVIGLLVVILVRFLSVSIYIE